MVQVHDARDAAAPTAKAFASGFEVVRNAVLQCTEIGKATNHNKYYCVELHKAGGSFRVFTHYGRADDLEKNPEAGKRECRYFESDQTAAEREYDRIYKEKTGRKKEPYTEVHLASAKVGSAEARGKSAGQVDPATAGRAAVEARGDRGRGLPDERSVELGASIRDLVACLFQEATGALLETVQASITAKGVETPLGVLTLAQIEKGETKLKQIHNLVASHNARPMELERLSSDFYTLVPHKLGRTKQSVLAAVISDLNGVIEKQETLQLMRDMLTVTKADASVLATDSVTAKYRAMGCEITSLASHEARVVAEWAEKTRVKRGHRVKNVWRIYRTAEQAPYEAESKRIGNVRRLLHGSRTKNWMGLLSRGILLPKIVVSMGVKRTDAGWMGNGLYFGDAICTAGFYAGAGHSGRRFMAVADVALGKVHDLYRITYGLNEAPNGCDSCHGVARRNGQHSEFDDEEYCAYRPAQQRLVYLMEFV